MSKTEIRGLQALVKKMNGMISEAAICRGIEKTCMRIEQDAKIACPVDMGQLKASITASVDKANLEGKVATEGVEYGAYVEYGTGIFSTEGNGREDRWSYQTPDGVWHSTIGQQPQPYLIPAFEKHKKKALEDIKNEIMRGAANG